MPIIFSELTEKFRGLFKFDGGGGNMQYILAGTLVLIIIISLVSLISTLTDSDTPKTGDSELHFWDIEKQQEFTKQANEMDFEMMMMVDGPEAQLVQSPLTGKKTGIMMIKCPNCKRYFIPEDWKQGKIAHDAQKKCTHCGTDYDEYYRKKAEERKARRKSRGKSSRRRGR
ncbi:MAG: zinc-ribbon domain-containing protein [Phycisphaerae bacterium]|nr:zinc-ribbon domain-containing protein [Phycisphaerae bacterium]